MVFWISDCIAKKPGERCPACQTRADSVPGPARHVDAGSSGHGGTRGSGCTGVVRSLVPHRGTGPGPQSPLF